MTTKTTPPNIVEAPVKVICNFCGFAAHEDATTLFFVDGEAAICQKCLEFARDVLGARRLGFKKEVRDRP